MTRRMTMSPLGPRTAGSLKGFGFTVTFDDIPASPADQGGQESGTLDSLPANANAVFAPNQAPVSPIGVRIPHHGSIGQ